MYSQQFTVFYFWRG